MMRGYEGTTNADLAVFLRNAWDEYWTVRNEVMEDKKKRFPNGGQTAFFAAHKHLSALRHECLMRTGSVRCEDDAIKLLIARPNHIRIPKV